MDREHSLESLTIEVTNACYLSCLHCSTEAVLDSSERLSLETVQQVINDLRALGGRTIEISGGEPLLYSYLLDSIRYAKTQGLETSLFTCGVFKPLGVDPTDDELSGRVGELKDAELDKVFVSLHGSNAEYHNEVAQAKCFNTTINFIRRLVKEGFYVGVHFVPLTINFESLRDITGYAATLGCKEIRFLRFVPQGRGSRNRELLTLSKDESLELVEMLSQKLDSVDIKVQVGSHLDFCFLFRPDHNPQSCMAGISKCLVTAKGEVVPCAVFKGLPDYIAGNVHQSSLYQIWKTSKVFVGLRDFKPERMKGDCAECSYLSLCRGRCPAQRVYDWRDLYQGPDRYCPKVALGRRRRMRIL
jgi:radical SAM protein with 4Fe4S-binding SPASM domain